MRSRALIAAAGALAALAAWLVPPAGAGADDTPRPCVTLRAPQPVYDPGDPVAVEVAVWNCGDRYLLLMPHFVPERLGREPEPWGEVVLEVEDDLGKPHPRTGRWLGGKLAKPEPGELTTLAPGEFQGGLIDLTRGPYARALPAGRSYRIRAKYHTSARRWIERLRERPSTLDPAHSLDGDWRSNEIVVTIREHARGEADPD